MSLKTLIDDHVSRVFLNTDHFAETIIRTPKNGTPITDIAAIIFDRGTQERPRGSVLESIRIKEIWTHADNLEELDRLDTFEFDDTTWAIDEMATIKTDGDYVGITVWSKDPIRIAPEKYRR